MPSSTNMCYPHPHTHPTPTPSTFFYRTQCMFFLILALLQFYTAYLWNFIAVSELSSASRCVVIDTGNLTARVSIVKGSSDDREYWFWKMYKIFDGERKMLFRLETSLLLPPTDLHDIIYRPAASMLFKLSWFANIGNVDPWYHYVSHSTLYVLYQKESYFQLTPFL